MAQGPQSFSEGLSNLASDAMRLAALPDADPKFCMMLAQAVVAKARSPQAPGGVPGGGHPPGGPAPSPGAGGPPGPPPSPLGGMPGGAPGGSPANGAMPTLGAPTLGQNGPSMGLSPGANNADEIRRMIAGNAGA